MISAPVTDLSRPALIADIGGTNVRFGLAYPGGEVRQVHVLPVRNFPDPAAAAEAFLTKIHPADRPVMAVFGVATVVAGDRLDLTNHPWTFSIEETRQRLGLEDIRVVNDVQALTLAVPHLDAADRSPIGSGSPVAETPLVVVAPGTGLGAAALIPFDGTWTPVATEAGHATVPAVNAREAEVIARLKRQYGHVSFERVVSGPGLVNLYRAICEIENVSPDTEADPAAVVKRGNSGACPYSTEALEVFAAMLGNFAGNMALTFCARGGIFIGGGVVPKMGKGFDGAIFRRRFEEKGRFKAYLSPIPTYLITHPTPALIGLAQAT